jgi:anthranilate synthase component 1
MIQPDFKSFSKLAQQGNLVPVYDTFTADTLTPVSAYLRLAQNARYACLLESVEGGEKIARYTFVGANPAEVFRYVNGACVLESDSRTSWMQENPIDYLRNRVERYRPVRVPGLPPLVAGAIGYFSYDMVRLIERIPDTTRDDVGMDDAIMMFFLGLVVFDHVRHRVWIVRNVFTGGEGGLRAKYNQAVREIEATRRRLAAPVPAEHPKRRKPRPFKVTSNFSRAKFIDAVNKSKEYIRAGDIFQVAVSQRFAAKTDADPFEIYRSLRVVNPSPYMYFLKLNDLAVVGSSPEMLVKVQGRDAYYRPIAGTRARGANEKEDADLEAELAADPKEQAEHIMLVDLGRNDLGRVSEYGTVQVERLMFVERYSHVMHLVSRRHTVWRAESPRHGNHRRTRADATRHLRRRHLVPRFFGESRFLHCDSHHGGKKGRGLRAGGGRAGRGLGTRKGIHGNGEQGARAAHRSRNRPSG